MELSDVKAPEAAFAKLREWMSKRPGIISNIQNNQENSAPHKIYQIELDDLLATGSLEKAKVVGWRFLQRDENRNPATFDVRVGEKPDTFLFNAKGKGDTAEEHHRLLETYRERSEKEWGKYEHSILRMGTLRIHAIWFHEAKKEDDLFVPMSPAFYGLVAGKAYKYNEFMSIVLEAAKDVKAHLETLKEDDMRGG